MSTMIFKRSHTMAPEQLKNEVQAMADKLVDKFGGSAEWQGDDIHYHFSGGLKACVACQAEEVSVEVELSGLMAMFKGRVEEEIESYLASHIH